MSLRVLANENVPREVVDTLRSEGHDVRWAADTPGQIDEEVVALAADERRVLLIFDKDFGELAFRSRLAPPAGVVPIRVTPSSPNHVSQVVSQALAQPRQWGGHFSVIEDTHIRVRPLSPSHRPRR